MTNRNRTRLVAAAVSACVAVGFQPAAAQDLEPVVLGHELAVALDDLAEWLTVNVEGGIQRAIDEAAAEFGVDPGLLHAIARCESGYRHDAKNPTSSARGVFQHLAGADGRSGYYRARAIAIGYPEDRIDAFRARQNIRAGAWLLATSGAHHWNPSRHCWSR